VINFDSAEYIKSADEWRPIPGSIEAIARLHKMNVKVYIATNQAGIGRGIFTEATLGEIHGKMLGLIESAGGKISGIQYCPHHPDEHCSCRKPEPGMLLAIADSTGIDITNQPFVGDTLKDLLAGEAAGCCPVLVLTGNGAATLEQRPDQRYVFNNLLDFVESLEHEED
jgi:D-glycero-D-manno-heptose 1,7-bisphosphate phosphatase